MIPLSLEVPRDFTSYGMGKLVYGPPNVRGCGSNAEAQWGKRFEIGVDTRFASEGAVFLRMPKIMDAAFRQPPNASNIQYANTALGIRSLTPQVCWPAMGILYGHEQLPYQSYFALQNWGRSPHPGRTPTWRSRNRD